jgi:hypothetical protein
MLETIKSGCLIQHLELYHPNYYPNQGIAFPPIKLLTTCLNLCEEERLPRQFVFSDFCTNEYM